jgi:trehalose 6-phosphate synthase/phosphatase
MLLLDLDGTLAPLAPRPELAEVPKATLAAIRRLVAQGWRVGIVSGRPAAEARRMVPLRGVRVFGSHGLEGSWGPRRRGRAVPVRLRRRLAALARSAKTLAAGTPGAWVERKPAGVAIHDRSVPRSRLAAWRRRRSRWLAGQELEGLEKLAGKRVLELRPEGVHKGRVVAQLPLPGRADASLIAIGDDRTDEDLFRAVRGRGLGVRVGRAGVRTLARHRLASPHAVRRFLERLAGG